MLARAAKAFVWLARAAKAIFVAFLGDPTHSGGTAESGLGEPAGQAIRTDYLRVSKNPNRQSLVGEHLFVDKSEG